MSDIIYAETTSLDEVIFETEKWVMYSVVPLSTGKIPMMPCSGFRNGLSDGSHIYMNHAGKRKTMWSL